MVGPHKSFFLARTQMISKGGRDMMWRFRLQHILALDIMRELGWANVLGNGVPKQLQKGQRGSLAHVHYSCQIRIIHGTGLSHTSFTLPVPQHTRMSPVLSPC